MNGDPSTAPAAPAWHESRPQDALDRLGVDPATGLSPADATRRLAEHGRNEIEKREPFSWPGALARQFLDPLILVLLVAATISAVVGDATDAIVIGVIVALNGLLGFTQEWRAERALAALAEMLAPTCHVLRDGGLREIDAREVVPGDIVDLAAGARAPADLKLIDAIELRIDESALTGESAPVSKSAGTDPADAPLSERRSLVHAGTLAATGRGRGVVIATGSRAEFGRIALMAATIERAATPLQRRLGRLGRRLGLAAAGMAGVITLSGWLGGRDALEMFLTGVSLAVAAVPEGLPAVVALSLTFGVRAMARRNALVRRLRAAESLGSATVICTDKTGTLTTGRMEVVRIATSADDITLAEADAALPAEARALFESAHLCNDAASGDDGAMQGSPTETALARAARDHAGLAPEDRPARLAEAPFSSERKRMAAAYAQAGAEGGDGEGDGAIDIHAKGAIESILPRCAFDLADGTPRPLDAARRAEWESRAHAMGADGLRVIALARRLGAPGADARSSDRLEQALTFVGLMGLLDPERPRARDAVATARAAGVRVIMITGDAPATASAIAERVGLLSPEAAGGAALISGPVLDTLDDRQVAERLTRAVVVARATPEHKMRLVSLLQGAGEIVAMTGDGVNDAPALKRADIGVAMGIRGSDAAKAAADMVLLDDDFGTIVAAMREGRRQDANIRKFVRYLLASNLSEVIAVLVNILSGAPLILRPAQILWMNLVTDGATAVALSMEKEEPDSMARPPRAPEKAILGPRSLQIIAAYGVSIAAIALVLFHVSLSVGLVAAQTAALTAIVVLSKASVLNFRSDRSPLSRIGWFSNPWLLGAIALSLAVHVGAIFLPPTQAALGLAPPAATVWLTLIVASAVFIILPEAIKRRHARRGARPRR